MELSVDGAHLSQRGGLQRVSGVRSGSCPGTTKSCKLHCGMVPNHSFCLCACVPVCLYASEQHGTSRPRHSGTLRSVSETAKENIMEVFAFYSVTTLTFAPFCAQRPGEHRASKVVHPESRRMCHNARFIASARGDDPMCKTSKGRVTTQGAHSHSLASSMNKD